MKLMKSRKKSYFDKMIGKKSINDPNEINTSVEIPMYAPNQGLTPKEYQLSARLNELEFTFQDRCISFLRKSNPDAFNSSYMDSIIERVCIDAIEFIKVQRSDHIQTITKPLNDMHKGDYMKCKSKLEDFKRDKVRNAKELAKYQKIYYNGTSLAEEEE